MTSLKLASAGSARAPNQWPESDASASARPHLPSSQHPNGSALVDSEAERLELESAFSDLTNREREVLFALCDGGNNEHVADRLCIALPTLRTHLMRLHQKLGTSGKSELVGLVWRQLTEAYRRGRLRAGNPEVGRSEK
jgi:DNA-binding CsgD family transcriptional regulator